jgi:hypothetical protein
MKTSIGSITRLARQARACSVPLLVAGVLAAGCGTVHESGGTAAAGSGTSTASAPKASATPVPTITGGPNIPISDPACADWPLDAPHGRLTALFDPVLVERCVTGFKQIPGKGEWRTATLERSTDNLAALAQVLLRPSGVRQPDVFCPEFVVLPPQIVLTSSTGKQLIPQLPVSGCGILDSAVLTTLASMSWQPVSVRLLDKVTPSADPPLPGASIGPQSPKMLQTAAGVPPVN